MHFGLRQDNLKIIYPAVKWAIRFEQLLTIIRTTFSASEAEFLLLFMYLLLRINAAAFVKFFITGGRRLFKTSVESKIFAVFYLKVA